VHKLAKSVMRYKPGKFQEDMTPGDAEAVKDYITRCVGSAGGWAWGGG